MAVVTVSLVKTQAPPAPERPPWWAWAARLRQLEIVCIGDFFSVQLVLIDGPPLLVLIVVLITR